MTEDRARLHTAVLVAPSKERRKLRKQRRRLFFEIIFYDEVRRAKRDEDVGLSFGTVVLRHDGEVERLRADASRRHYRSAGAAPQVAHSEVVRSGRASCR